jgi:hypothetical protein
VPVLEPRIPARQAGLAAESAGFAIAAERDLRPGVVAAFEADDGAKRAFIDRLVDRPLLGIFREFAALHGNILNDAFRRAELGYRAFALTPV